MSEQQQAAAQHLETKVGRGAPPPERLEAELEQARVIVEDLEQRLVGLESENERLRSRLADEQRARNALETRIERLIAEQGPSGAGDGTGMVLREQLANALEELEVMAEELEMARNTLNPPQPA